MSSLAQLREEHAELVKIVAELRVMVDGAEPPATLALYDVRRRLTGTLIAHLKAEDWLLYPPLLECADAEVASTARQFVDEMGGLAAAFSLYVEKWDAIRIANHWTDYQRETREVLEALATRIVRENRDLYPLLERVQKAA